MALPLSIVRDAGGAWGANDVGLPFADLGQYFTLTATDVTSVTVPPQTSFSLGQSRMLAVFSFASTSGTLPVVWVQLNSSPTLTEPSGTVTSTTAVLNPVARTVIGGQTLQFLTAQSDIVVSITYYAIQ